jgi:hypothetical protein
MQTSSGLDSSRHGFVSGTAGFENMLGRGSKDYNDFAWSVEVKTGLQDQRVLLDGKLRA